MLPDDKTLDYIHLLFTYIGEKAPALITEPVPLSDVPYRNFIYSSSCVMDCHIALVKPHRRTAELLLQLLG